ncbi:GntR family transcriptional regulator [Sphingobium algorifonticola]|uniref:GntR family transcriptional regulator n=1 Tax=Sphingobium algorifonticola TaxID=2008318 RepID=A0A437JA18_9SPHN|nr:GntR family transcriptional regulator [Sphingobium algorifonticola]RVT42356.1 GntR family transcriptional regulator [Sphingobium algorifonticola]
MSWSATPHGPPVELGKAQEAYNHLREAILTFELRGGQPVSERMLGDEVGSSRTSVRAALARLEADGLIRRRGRSYEVTSIDPQEIGQAHELLLAIEPAALLLAQDDGLREKLDAMQGIVDRVVADPALETYSQAVLDYHSALVRLSGNDFFARASDDAQTRLVRAAWLTRWLDPAARLDWAPQNKIIKLMRRNERKEAAKILSKLLRDSQRHMTSLVIQYRQGLLAHGVAVDKVRSRAAAANDGQ